MDTCPLGQTQKIELVQGALEDPDRSKYWFKDGKKHREDGPAVEKADGTKKWYLNGKKLSERKWKETIKTRNFESPERPQLNESKRRSVIKLIIKS